MQNGCNILTKIYLRHTEPTDEEKAVTCSYKQADFGGSGLEASGNLLRALLGLVRGLVVLLGALLGELRPIPASYMSIICI